MSTEQTHSVEHKHHTENQSPEKKKGGSHAAKKIGVISFLAVLHIIAIAIILNAFLPMAKWYYDARPLWGVDFYYTASIVNSISHNLVFPAGAWGYSWFSGWPLLSNYPILQYYNIIPFTHFFSLIDSIKLWMLISLFLYIIGIYAVAYVLSRNFAIAIVLSLTAIYSVGVYGPFMWGGSLPSHATQAFLPWVMFFSILYLKKNNRAYLFLSSILAGIAILAHPQIVIAYIYPFIGLLYFFSFGTIPFWQRIKALFAFLIISFIIGLPLLYSSMGGALKSFVVTDAQKVASSTAKIPSNTAEAIDAFNKAQPFRMYTDTNTTLFLLLGISASLFILFLVFRQRGKRLLSILPFFVLALFSTVYVWMFAYGISIYHGGWYRLFWAVPFWVGMLIAALWGAWQEKFSTFLKKKPIIFIFECVMSIIVLVGGYSAVQYYAHSIQDKITIRSNQSSAYPDIVNFQTSTEDLQKLKQTMLPSWIDGDNMQYRLYSGDQTFNIWWNSIYKMPLSRGYFDPPVTAENRGFFFLLDSSLSQDTAKGEDQLVSTFHYPPQVALNNTLYLVDWYGVKYIQAGPSVAGITVLPKSFNNPSYIQQDQILEFNSQKYNKTNMALHYYEVKDEFTSPILMGTNASTLGIIASDTGYETILRNLADMNMSSRQVIPVRLGSDVDKLATKDLVPMDALIVYDYNYSNKGNAYKLLTEYVKKGKKLFIETGTEVKEATSTDSLPEIFPIDKDLRKPLGTSWEIETVDADITNGVDFTKFDPPVFNDAPWSISYAPNSSDVREGAKVILKNKGFPVMASQTLGDGLVIWSGLNFPYHAIRSHNEVELGFLKNIFAKLLEGTAVSGQPSYTTTFINPQQRQITTQGARGVLFKEQDYPGWSAKISGAASAKLYKAGPAYPGFMYVRLPDIASEKQTTVTFNYGGSWAAWIYSILAVLLIIFLLEEAFLGGRILGRLRLHLWKKGHTHVRYWWAKDDD